MGKQVAIVTGAARGIGRAIAERLANDGLTVVMADLDESGNPSDDVATTLPHGGRMFALRVNVADENSVRAMVQAVIDREGQIDILVNNAGIVGAAIPVVDYSLDEWRRVMAINLDGAFLCCRAVLPHMLARRYGHIVNIASISGKEGNPKMAAYSASKAGLIGFTKALAKELAQDGILVNCVTPAVIRTDMMQRVSAETLTSLVSKIPMGRIGQPEEVAALVSWLASEACSFSTGAVFDISGGRATY